MSLKRGVLVQFLAICMLLHFVHGLMGESVRLARSGDCAFVVSLSSLVPNNTIRFRNMHFCTGSLISHRSVLTAAHCLLNRSINEVEVLADSTNLRKGHRYQIESWITFDQWNQFRKAEFRLNDIAVITLKGEGLKHIHPVQVLTVTSEYLEDQEIRILGWGKLEHSELSTSLKAAFLKVVSNKECSEHGTMLKGTKFTVPANFFCSKAKPWVISTCGDGGAPILNKRRRLVGINIGACPKVDGYPKDMLNELLMNSHIHLHYYRDFLTHVML